MMSLLHIFSQIGRQLFFSLMKPPDLFCSFVAKNVAKSENLHFAAGESLKWQSMPSHSALSSYDRAVCKLSIGCDVCVSFRPQELSSAENQCKACRNNRQAQHRNEVGEAFAGAQRYLNLQHKL